jgi:tetratricopeptide (TPR) repeat protein
MVLEYLKVSVQISVVALLLLFIILYRKEIRLLFVSLASLKVKKGDTEISFSQRERVPEKDTEPATTKASTDKDEEVCDKQTLKDDNCEDPLCCRIMKAIIDDDKEKAETLNKELLKGESDPIKRLRIEACYYYQLALFKNDSKALFQLKELTNNKNAAGFAHNFLGICYQRMNQHDLALLEFEKQLSYAVQEKEKATSIQGTCSCLYQIGKKTEAFEKIRAAIKEYQDKEAQRILWAELVSLYDQEKNYPAKAIASEKLLAIDPENSFYRFAAAWAYAEAGFQGMALLHYKTYCQQRKDEAGGLNNLGVVYDKLGLPFRSMNAYKLAAEQKNSLAMSNIAYKYINGGFKDEADKILKQASECKEIYPNVGEALAKLKNKEKQEEEKMEQYLQSAREKQSFLRDYAEAIELTNVSSVKLEGIFIINDKEFQLEIKQGDKKISFVPVHPEEPRIEYRGTFSKRTILISSAHVFRQAKDEEERVFDDGNKVLGIISEYANEIKILEYDDSSSSITAWKKKQESPAV